MCIASPPTHRITKFIRRIRHGPEGDDLTVDQMAMLELRQQPKSEVCMTMAVFPQELLTLVAWPEHAAPYYSSICVTYGPVSASSRFQRVFTGENRVFLIWKS